MTEFEKKIRDDLVDCIEDATYHDEDCEDEVLDIVLCDDVTLQTPNEIIKKIMEKDEFKGLETQDFSEAYNKVKCEFIKTYTLDKLDHYRYYTGILKDGKLIGTITLMLKYNTTEDCEDLIKYKFIPKGKEDDEDDIKWIVFHG